MDWTATCTGARDDEPDVRRAAGHEDWGAVCVAFRAAHNSVQNCANRAA